MSLLGGARGVPGVWRSAGHLLQPGGQGRLPGRGEAGLRLDAGSWVLGPRAGGPCPGLRLTRPEAPCLPLTSPWTSPHPHLCHCHPVHLVALPQTPAFEVLAHLVASPKCCLIQEASPSVVPGGPLLLHPQLSLRPSMTAHSSHMAVTPHGCYSCFLPLPDFKLFGASFHTVSPVCSPSGHTQVVAQVGQTLWCGPLPLQ